MLRSTMIHAIAVVSLAPWAVSAQEETKAPATIVEKAEKVAESATSTAEELAKQASETVGKAAGQAREKVGELAQAVEKSEQAKKVSGGLLDFIYTIAEHMSFPAFHWLAFALMVGGTVGFALQLVLGKLVVLATGGFSITEILSDALGFLVSLVGLVLTTQAAAENSTFTQSTVAVLSSAFVGLLVGILLYIWGQSQELQARRGRSKS